MIIILFTGGMRTNLHVTERSGHTANVSSHWAAAVPASPRPNPIPTLLTRPSIPASAAADSATTAAHA